MQNRDTFELKVDEIILDTDAKNLSVGAFTMVRRDLQHTLVVF